jgi:hypothetical protein
MAYTPTDISAAAASVVPYENAATLATKWVSPTGNDANAGTAAAPYKTIQHGVNSSTPGTAVMVKAGTYTENVKLTKSGTADKPIWLASADGEGAATIKAANAGVSTVYGHGIDNVVVQGFKVTGSTEGFNITQNGTSLTNMATNIVVEDNTVHGHSRDGIKTSQTVNSAVTNNTVYNIGSQEGIDNVYMRNGVIANNDVSDVRGLTGIIAKGGSQNVRIEGNDVSGVRDGIAVGGFTTGQGSTFPSGISYEAKNFTVANNTVAGNSKAVGVFAGQDSTIRDNALKTASTWVATTGGDNNGYKSSGIQFVDNTVSKSNWLYSPDGAVTVNTGNAMPGASPPPPSPPLTLPPPSSSIPLYTITHDWRDSGAVAKYIYGTAASDTLAGTSGNDRFDAGSGIDRMTGGAGDDRYAIGSRYDAAIEASGGGRDTAMLWDSSYTLATNVENLIIYKSTGATVRDNTSANILTGGVGPDTFAFAASHGHDLIRGFKVGSDHIRIDGTAIADIDVAQTSSGAMVLKHGASTITLAGVDAHTPLSSLF